MLLSLGGAKPVGSEDAADKLGEYFSCSSVIPGGPEVQGVGKGPPGKGGTAK